MTASYLAVAQVGPVADGLVEKGWSITDVRKLSQACFGLAAEPLG